MRLQLLESTTMAYYPPKLTEEQKLIVIRMSCEFISSKDIVKYIKETWSITYTSAAIHDLMKAEKNQIYIKKFREDYLKRIKDVPIANKRIRVDDLEKLRVKAMKALEENKCDTKNEREEFRHLVRTLNDIIANAREEMEKKPMLVQQFGALGDLSDKSDDDLIRERDELIKQAERLITGRTSETNTASEGTQAEDLPEPS